MSLCNKVTYKCVKKFTASSFKKLPNRQDHDYNNNCAFMVLKIKVTVGKINVIYFGRYVLVICTTSILIPYVETILAQFISLIM